MGSVTVYGQCSGLAFSPFHTAVRQYNTSFPQTTCFYLSREFQEKKDCNEEGCRLVVQGGGGW